MNTYKSDMPAKSEIKSLLIPPVDATAYDTLVGRKYQPVKPIAILRAVRKDFMNGLFDSVISQASILNEPELNVRFLDYEGKPFNKRGPYLKEREEMLRYFRMAEIVAKAHQLHSVILGNCLADGGSRGFSLHSEDKELNLNICCMTEEEACKWIGHLFPFYELKGKPK